VDWITREIAIGNRIDAHDAVLRAQHGIQAVISLDGSMTDEIAVTLGYEDSVCLSLVDGPGNSLTAYRRVVQDLIDMVKGSPRVLVHCHAGRSRSVTVVAGYLVTVRGWTVRAAYDYVATKRDIAVQEGLPDLVHALRRQCLKELKPLR
jgi:protein-tyrosine phosphatase